jgi:glyoxylase I family protein
MKSELDHVALRTADLGASVRFYEALLGSRSVTLLPPNDDIGQVELVRVGDHHGIELFEEGRGQASKESPGTGLIHLALGVDDVDGAYANALQSGAEAMRGPVSTVVGGAGGPAIRGAFIYGPGGELIEFIQRGWARPLFERR